MISVSPRGMARRAGCQCSAGTVPVSCIRCRERLSPVIGYCIGEHPAQVINILWLLFNQLGNSRNLPRISTLVCKRRQVECLSSLIPRQRTKVSMLPRRYRKHELNRSSRRCHYCPPIFVTVGEEIQEILLSGFELPPKFVPTRAHL